MRIDLLSPPSLYCLGIDNGRGKPYLAAGTAFRSHRARDVREAAERAFGDTWLALRCKEGLSIVKCKLVPEVRK